MVFIDSTGNQIGEVPIGYQILNTESGKHNSGWRKGMAGNTVGDLGLIPIKNFETKDIMLIDFTGKPVVRLGQQYSSVTPCYNGFHIAFVDSHTPFSTTTYYYLDQSGKCAFSCSGYKFASIFHDGLAAVRKENSWLYVNEQGEEFQWIDTSLKHIQEVTPFYDGLSLIKFGRGKKCGFSNCYDFAFMDKEGVIVLDSRKLFPSQLIKQMSIMSKGISLVSFYSDSTIGGSNHIAYINQKGKIIAKIDNVSRLNGFVGPYAPIDTYKKDGTNGSTHDSVYLLTPMAEKIFFEVIDDFVPYEVFYLNDSMYYVSTWRDQPAAGMGRIFNASTHQYVFSTKEIVMGTKWSLISLLNYSTKQYYVVDYKTGKVVYDTDFGDRIWSNIDSALLHANEVRHFVCEESSTRPRLNKLLMLKELRLKNMDDESLPYEFNFQHLDVFRIDGMMGLKKFPTQMKELQKIALRNCVQANNLMELLEGQQNLNELFLINFDLTENDEMIIREKFPFAKIVVSGSPDSASNPIQEFIEGF